MTLYVTDITIDQVIDALGSYVQIFTPVQIIRGNVNRTAMPISPFIELTEIASSSINKPIETYISADQTEIINEHTRLEVQIDLYGWELSDTVKALHSSFRTIWASDQFPTWVMPLYCSEPMKMPVPNGEEQYEQRWTMRLSLQYNPAIIVPQQSMLTAVILPLPIDTTFTH